jgi:hypothetical protein
MKRLGIHIFCVFAGWWLLLEVRKSLGQTEELVLLKVGLGAALLGHYADGRRDSAWQMSATQHRNVCTFTQYVILKL